MLKTARKGYVPDNLTFEREDAAFLSFDDDTFDVVIIANALHIIPQPEKVLAEIESRLSVCDSIEHTVDTALQQAEAMRQSILKQAFEGRL